MNFIELVFFPIVLCMAWDAIATKSKQFLPLNENAFNAVDNEKLLEPGTRQAAECPKPECLAFLNSYNDCVTRSKPVENKANEVLLVVGGFSSAETDDIEIVNISSTKTCRKPSNYPFKGKESIGFIDSGTRIVVCGGNKIPGSFTDECYFYSKGTWTFLNKMTKPRFAAAELTLKTLTQSQVIVSGGIGPIDNTIELLTSNGWQRLDTLIPLSIEQHCMVQIDPMTIMFIAGHKSGQYSIKQTFFLNINTKKWTNGPDLNNGRAGHACFVQRGLDGVAKSVVVAAGCDEKLQPMSSVEIWDVGSNSWRAGPSIPNSSGMCYVEGVADSAGNFYISGGLQFTRKLNEIYRLSVKGSIWSWTKLPQTLQTGRYSHTHLMVPDTYLDCS